MPDAARQPLGTTGWWIWSHFTVRSTGFPLAELDAAVVAEPSDPDLLRRAVDLAAGDRIVSALRWQNPAVVEQVLVPLALRVHDGTPPTKKDRRRERTLASYLQRYHTRNETVGFFGPIAWGRVDADGDPIAVSTGRQLTDRQAVWFEDWAVDRLAREFARDPTIRRYLQPVRAPASRRLGRMVITADGRQHRLGDTAAGVLDLCDGRRSGAEIVAAGRVGEHGDTTAHAALDALVDAGVVLLEFGVPVHHHADRALQRDLDAMPDEPAVRSARAVLGQLIETRERVAAAEDADELAAALAKSDECFRAATGELPRRSAEQARRGRTLLVAQHRRSVDVVVGAAVRDELAGPLELVLRTARWFTWRVGELALEHLGSAHVELAPLYGPAVPLDVLALRLLAFVRDPATGGDLDAEARRRWGQIVDLDPNPPVLHFATADLAGPIAEAFACPVPTWYAGRHHSPDVMIAARDVDAIRRGEYEFVLGEVHSGAVTVDSATHNWLDPAPEAIQAPSEAALDDGPERYVPLYRRGMAGVTARSYPVPETYSDRYRYLSFGHPAGERAVPDGCRLEMSSMYVLNGADGLVVALPDGSTRPALVVVGEMLSLLDRSFGFAPRWPHAPRVKVDRLVIARETWRVPAEEFALPANRPDLDPLGRLAGVAERFGLPRRSFWRAEYGAKPIYLDLRSPLLVGLAAAGLRNAAPGTAVTFTEMLPGPGQLWLADAKDRRYTSELRLTVAEGAGTGDDPDGDVFDVVEHAERS